MARLRSIKPEFPQSESLGHVSRDARLLFVLLWPICDDHGRTRAAPRMLASLLFPYDDDAPGLVGGWLNELERADCIRRYEVDGCSYLHIPKWLIHQKIDKPSLPVHPSPPETLAKPREGSALEGKGREGNGEDQGISPTAQETAPPSPTAPASLKLVSDTPKPDHEFRIVETVLLAYHQTLPLCRQMHVVTPKQRKKILAADKLAGTVCKQQGWTGMKRADFWLAYFGECLDDPWLRGETPNPRNPRWKQNLLVLIDEERFAEIMDRAIAAGKDKAA